MASRNANPPSPARKGALTMVSCSPRSSAAPVPGKSGIWWVEAYMTLGSSQKMSCVPLP